MPNQPLHTHIPFIQAFICECDIASWLRLLIDFSESLLLFAIENIAALKDLQCNCWWRTKVYTKT